jgi:cobalt-zinc-cadmium efflux system outer membrane protein
MMLLPAAIRQLFVWVALGELCCLALPARGRADPSPLPPHVMTLSDAVLWALQYNPDLAVTRQQRGIASAGIVIARTYPFNPLAENRVQASNGPTSAGITNRVPIEQLLLWEVEVRGQGTYRRQGATATLRRTEWEIAFQEQTLAVRVIRAFSTLIYRQEKLRLLEETVRINDQFVQDLRRSLGLRVTPANLIVAQSEVDASRALLGTGRANLTAARFDFHRALGIVEGEFELQGTLDIPEYTDDAAALLQTALERRADLRARRAALDEAGAALRLEIANRYGNPTIGPAYTYDPTRVNAIGGQLNFPIPIVNTHRGEILQRQAQRDAAVLDVRRTEVDIRHDVEAALSRLHIARAWVGTYRNQTLPNLRGYRDSILLLFQKGQVDLLSVIDIRRKLITAQDGYLDALYELSQARADLAAAIGEPIVAGVACSPPGP